MAADMVHPYKNGPFRCEDKLIELASDAELAATRLSRQNMRSPHGVVIALPQVFLDTAESPKNPAIIEAGRTRCSFQNASGEPCRCGQGTVLLCQRQVKLVVLA